MLANPNSGRLRCPMPSQFLHPSSPKCILFPNCSRSLPCFTSSKSKFCTVALLLPRKNGKGFGSRALAEPQVSVGAPQGYPQPFSVKIPVGDRHILVETGHIGRQSSAAVIVTDGKTIFRGELAVETLTSTNWQKFIRNVLVTGDIEVVKRPYVWVSAFLIGQSSWLISTPVAQSRDIIKTNAVYEIGEFFELGIQLSYLLLLLGFLGIGTFFVIRQVLVRRELDLSAKELQEQVRSGDANATELFELGAVMLRRKVYPAATKYLVQAIENWDGDDQDLAQVYNALGVSYVRDGKLSKGIKQFETAVKLQPGYVTAWNNLGDAYEQKKDYKAALNAFEEVLLFDPNNKVAQPRRDALKDQVKMYRDVPVKTKER